MRERGFTVVELIIVMVAMAVLLTLTMLSMKGYQANARDEERKGDIDSIARGLEQRYISGNSKATGTYITKGTYPSVNELQHAKGSTIADLTPTAVAGGYLTTLFPGTSDSTFITPDNGQLIPICTATCTPNASATTTISTYVYAPYDVNDNICINTACIKYDLYYRKETTPTILERVMSKRQ